MKKFRRVVALLLAAALVLGCCGALAASGDTPEEPELTEEEQRLAIQDRLWLLLDIIENYSLYETDDEASLFVEALSAYFLRHPEDFTEFADAFMQTQDGYSHYMEPEVYDSSYTMNDSFVGIGVELENANDGLIKVVYPNTPADEAGIKAGDFIFSVNGREIPEGEFYNVFQTKLRGEEGTSVTVGVRRGDKTLSFTMVRRKVVLSNVSTEDMGDGVAYVRISHFGDDISTFVDFVNAYNGLDEQGFTSVVFDVRSNNGGDASVLANILNQIIWEKDAAMFTERNRFGEEVTHLAMGLGWEPEQVVVLTNDYTASSAEIFAGVLGEVAGATIVGESEYTYGKGVGQYVFSLEDGTMILITASEALIGEDIHYHGKGIKADMVVSPAYDYAAEELLPLNPELQFYPHARGNVVKATEQRLAVLGLFHGTPDVVCDSETLEALHSFQRTHGFREEDFASRDVLTALRVLVPGLSGADAKIAASDPALAAAVALCKG